MSSPGSGPVPSANSPVPSADRLLQLRLRRAQQCCDSLADRKLASSLQTRITKLGSHPPSTSPPPATPEAEASAANETGTIQQPCSQSDSMTELDLLRDQLAKSELLRKQEQANAGVSAKEAADLKKALTSAQQKELAATQEFAAFKEQAANANKDAHLPSESTELEEALQLLEAQKLHTELVQQKSDSQRLEIQKLQQKYKKCNKINRVLKAKLEKAEAVRDKLHFLVNHHSALDAEVQEQEAALDKVRRMVQRFVLLRRVSRFVASHSLEDVLKTVVNQQKAFDAIVNYERTFAEAMSNLHSTLLFPVSEALKTTTDYITQDSQYTIFVALFHKFERSIYTIAKDALTAVAELAKQGEEQITAAVAKHMGLVDTQRWQLEKILNRSMKMADTLCLSIDQAPDSEFKTLVLACGRELRKCDKKRSVASYFMMPLQIMINRAALLGEFIKFTPEKHVHRELLINTQESLGFASKAIEVQSVRFEDLLRVEELVKGRYSRSWVHDRSMLLKESSLKWLSGLTLTTVLNTELAMVCSAGWKSAPSSDTVKLFATSDVLLVGTVAADDEPIGWPPELPVHFCRLFCQIRESDNAAYSIKLLKAGLYFTVQVEGMNVKDYVATLSAVEQSEILTHAELFPDDQITTLQDNERARFVETLCAEQGQEAIPISLRPTLVEHPHFAQSLLFECETVEECEAWVDVLTKALQASVKETETLPQKASAGSILEQIKMRKTKSLELVVE